MLMNYQHLIKKALEELPADHPARPALLLQLAKQKEEYQAALRADQDRYWTAKLEASEPTPKKKASRNDNTSN